MIAKQVIGRVRQRLHTDLPARSVFEAATIAELAVAIVKLEEQSPIDNTKIDRRIGAEELLSQVDELSEGELDTLLAEMLAEEKVSE